MIGKQLHVGKLHPTQKILQPIKNYIQCKAIGGLYTSSYLGEKLGSDWIQWCLCNEFNIPVDNIWNGWLLTIKKEANIFVVDSLEKMDFLYDRYGFTMFEGSNMEQINYEKMQKDYDGIHMTSHGEQVTRHGGMFSSHPRITMRSMYGWDCESTHLFKDVIESIEEVELKIEDDREAIEDIWKEIIKNDKQST
jgi:hypothetical protein